MKKLILLLLAVSMLLCSCKVDTTPDYCLVDYNTDGAGNIKSEKGFLSYSRCP